MDEPVTLDFETQAIASPPDFPPAPVGLAARLPGLGSVYLAWGHPEGNNCTKQTAYDLLRRVWDGRMLFQNGRFDIAVAQKAFNLPAPDPMKVEDTLYQLFLCEPLAPTLSLKSSAERLLGLPPTEQNAVRNWLVANRIVGPTDKAWGAHIARAPAQIVGPYAIGDVDRTFKLHELLMPRLTELGMLEAYTREKLLAPILSDNEKAGINVDLKGLKGDVVKYEKQFEKASAQIFAILGHTFNIDSGIELADVLQKSGKANIAAWPKTPTGRLSTARDALHSVITDPTLYALLSYRGALKTCLGTFFKAWLVQARACEGRLHPSWNAVRGDTGGTRTGRLSSYNPNFQNIPTEFPEKAPKGYLPLPLMRQYVLPNDGEVFVKADFHSQEVRVLGHFAEGAVQEIYRDNPSADVHAVAAGLIQDASGIAMERKQVKIIAFSILYGAGVTKIAEGLGVDVGKAAQMKRAYLDTLTGVRELMKEIENRASRKESVRSWGGRVLHAPAPQLMEGGRVWNKDYVLINYLVQGSSADQTKEALIRHGEFYITVHDEICISTPKKALKSEIKRLRHSMEEMAGWDIPMKVEVSTGPNWANLEKQ